MKRKLSFVICLMLLVISLCACGANKHSGGQYKAFTAYIDGSLPEGSGQKVRADRVLMTVKPEDLPEPRKSEISVSVLCKQYSAAYAGKDTVGYGIAGYKYETAQGDKLEVDSAGNIMQYKSAAAYDHAERYVTADEALSPEASLAKAREYLVQLFGKDVAARYDAPLPDTSTSTVWFHFKPTDRVKGAYTTAERISLALSEKGELLSYYAYHVGAFDGKDVPADFTDDRIKQIIGESLSGEHGDIELSDERKLITLEGGKIACTMSFRIAEDGAAGEWVSVVIPLE